MRYFTYAMDTHTHKRLTQKCAKSWSPFLLQPDRYLCQRCTFLFGRSWLCTSVWMSFQKWAANIKKLTSYLWPNVSCSCYTTCSWVSSMSNVQHETTGFHKKKKSGFSFFVWNISYQLFWNLEKQKQKWCFQCLVSSTVSSSISAAVSNKVLLWALIFSSPWPCASLKNTLRTVSPLSCIFKIKYAVQCICTVIFRISTNKDKKESKNV